MRTLKNTINLILGMIIGFFVIFCLSLDKRYISFFEKNFAKIKRPELPVKLNNIKELFIFFLICFLVVFIITFGIRFFTSTKNLQTTAKIMNVFVELILGVPITTIVFSILYNPLYSTVALLDNIVYELIVWCIIFSIFFASICISLEKSYFKVLKKGHKRCKLCICEVINETEYTEKNTIVKKLLFEQCYTSMKNYDEPLSNRQFYVIYEMNWNNTKVVDKWKYYHNLNFIYEDDEDLCKKMIIEEAANNINWQG